MHMTTFYQLFPTWRRIQPIIRKIRSFTVVCFTVCVFLVLSNDNPHHIAKYPRSLDSHDSTSMVQQNAAQFPLRRPTCKDPLNVTRILLVLRVHAAYSATRNFVRMKLENRTDCHMKAVFLYGKFTGTKAKDFQSTIDQERKAYGDVAQFLSVTDYNLRGQRAVDVMKAWVVRNPCDVYQQVAFGSFQLPAETLHQGLTLGKPEANWALDHCLIFTLEKLTNVQFFAHYYPPLLSTEDAIAVSKKLQQSRFFDYQDAVVSPHNFRYIVQPSKSISTKDYFAIIAVHSATNGSRQRNLIRSTWGHPEILSRYNMSLVFFLGRNKTPSPNDIKDIDSEATTFGDIVQSDFIDAYKNMTLKQISILKYISERFSHIRYEYLFKVDDDIVVDLRAVRRYFDNLPRSGLHPQRTFFCFHMNELAYAPRNSRTKWHVTSDHYPDRLHPAYCSGAGYLITKDLVAELYNAALHVPLFWVDDTFVSGLLPRAVGNVSLIQIPQQSLESVQFLRRYRHVGRFMLVHVQRDMELFQIYWEKFRSGMQRLSTAE